MDDDFGKRLGKHLRQLRQAAGLSQAALAERMKPSVEPETLGRWERGETSAPLPQLIKLATALNTTIDRLISGALLPTVPVPGGSELEGLVERLQGRPPAHIAGAVKVVEAYLEALDATAAR